MSVYDNFTKFVFVLQWNLWGTHVEEKGMLFK